MRLSGKTWIASAGETFDLIALYVYGDERYAAEILCVNPALSGTLVFEGGEQVLLPVVTVAAEGQTPETAPWKEG